MCFGCALFLPSLWEGLGVGYFETLKHTSSYYFVAKVQKNMKCPMPYIKVFS